MTARTTSHDQRADLLPVRRRHARAARRPGRDTRRPVPAVRGRAAAQLAGDRRSRRARSWLEEPPDDDPSTADVDESETATRSSSCSRTARRSRATRSRTPSRRSDPTTNQPNVTFDFTDEGREAFQEVTREISLRGQDELLRRHRPAGSDRRRRRPPPSSPTASRSCSTASSQSRPIINFKENPDGIDGRTGAQISGIVHDHRGPGPRRGAADRRAADQARADQPEHGLGDARRAGARPGAEGGLAGLAVVLLFLIAYYRFLGVVAGLGLLVYAVFFLALIKLIPITLTLPGIAGLILTIGVAADSNIVIFERIKEEVRAGRSMLSAISEGYKKGIATIIDANVITLITAFILFVLASAGVKGFAFTLGIGTIVSLFTAVLFTQAVLGVLGRARILRSPSFLGAGGEGRAVELRLHRRLAVVLLVLGRDPRDRRDRLRDQAAQPRDRLRVRHPDPGGARRGGVRRRDPRRARRRRHRRRRHGEDPGGREPRLRRQRRPDPGQDPPEPDRRGPAAARRGVRARGRDRLPGDRDRPDLRRADRALGGDRDHLQPAGDLGLRRDPLRGQVRGPGADRPDPRHPDHGQASTRWSAPRSRARPSPPS